MRLERCFQLCLLGLVTFGASVYAGPKEQAYKVFNRLNGIPPSEATWDQLTKLIESGNFKAAALLAIDADESRFYDVTLRRFVNPWTNENSNPRFPLNDYSATVIGFTRDELPMNNILSADVVYTGDNLAGQTLPAYSLLDNDHYLAIEEQNLSLKSVLMQNKQSEITALPEDAAAGVLTTRGFGAAFYVAGTNRAAVRFSFMTYLCRDMELMHDITIPDFHVRKDVSRAPGGDTATYKNQCVGCHAGMDALAGAFAYMDYNDDQGLVYNPVQVHDKFSINDETFSDGFETKNDSWINLWTEGQNSAIGWNGAKSGSGLKSWGKMLTSTNTFAMCMAERVLKAVCFVDTNQSEVQIAVRQLANNFKANETYNLKHLFANSALLCRGD